MTCPLKYRLLAWVIVLLWITGQARGSDSNALPEELYLAGLNDEPAIEIAIHLLSRAYGNLGIRIKPSLLPMRRSLLMSEAGVLDGEMARNPAIESQVDNLIRIPTPLWQLKTEAYATDPELSINSWQDLTGLKVGVYAGGFFARSHLPIEPTLTGQHSKQLFDQLTRGRIDVFICPKPICNAHRRNASNNPKVYQVSESLGVDMLYHYLHKKHHALVPLIDSQLKKLHDSGEAQAIYDSVVRDLGSFR